MRTFVLMLSVLSLALCSAVGAAEGDKKKIVFVAGNPSHGFGGHEHKAGCVLLAKALKEGLPNVETVVVEKGYPADDKVFDGASAIIVYCDGGGGHLLMKKLERFDEFMKQGVGLGCLHYAVEIPAGDPGDAFLRWIGGYFEANWSVNPHWVPNFVELPKHEVTQGVKPFTTNDEWYYHMRFNGEMKGVTPILSALPPASTLTRKDGPHEGNPAVRKAVLEDKEAQHVMWVYERPDGKGRGFGFTGGHNHWNWAQDDQRKLVLNAIAWIAHIPVPADGVSSARPTLDELLVQDEPVPQNFNKDEINKRIEDFNKPLAAKPAN
jgi:type 1 glutamine amidotransferase